ncbi:glycosyltransferase [Sphingomonas sp. RS2018]
MADPLGIVAIGRNEGGRLKRCLASIPAGIPVVYVDSDSTDGSVAAATAAGAIVLPLDLARPFTAARARAEGVALLQQRFPATRHVMFVDGDCELEAGWLDTATAYLAANPAMAAVCGRRRERFPEASFYNHVADWEWDTPAGEAASCGGDAMMRLDAYDAVGGFDPKMIAGEEPELCSRLRAAGWRIMRLDAPMTIHDAAILHFGQWWKRAVRGGFGYAQAWRATDGALYASDLTRMIVWAIVMPLLSIAAALLIHPIFLLVWPGLIAVQLWRLNRSVGWRHGGLAAIAHYAVLIGATRYAWRLSRGRTGGTLVYK